MPEKIILRTIEDDLRESYLDYAMSVIIGRAIPDARDGLKPVHRRIMFAMHEMGNTFDKPHKKSARAVGECFVKDTLVLTDRGLVPIQEIERGDRVYTQKNLETVRELFEMPERELVKVVLENGTANIATPSQKFKILNEELGFEWKEAENLKEGDSIVVRAVYPNIARPVRLGMLDGKEISLNENIAYLLGLWIAEGWLDKQKTRLRFNLYSNDKKTMERIGRILKVEFDYSATLEEKKYTIKRADGKTIRNTGYQIRINRGELNDFIIGTFELGGKKAATKVIPKQIFVSPRKVIYSFISGLVDGDGSVHNTRNMIHYGSVSERLIGQLGLVLQHMGVFYDKRIEKKVGAHEINGRTVKARLPLHCLEIRGKCAHMLAANLMLATPHKAARLAGMLGQRTGEMDYDSIPNGGEVFFGELSAQHIGSGWYLGQDGKKFRMGVRYPTGSKIRYPSDLRMKPLRISQIESWGIGDKLVRLGSQLAGFIEQMREENIYFIKVARVERAAPEKTYDIQVENEHEFIANGMLSHNCLGKFHPHGDVAIYDALIRMAQDFSLRYPLIHGQGNMGSIDGDSPASMRYTEVRLAKIADDILADLEKETVDWMDNFDGTLKEPIVMPAKIPNLLINGSSGIAVGMATNMPPHNLTEIVDGAIAVIDGADENALLSIVSGPDFPTGGEIVGRAGILQAYKTGRGIIRIRGKAHVDAKRNAIVISEIPYQVTKTAIIEAIAEAVKNKKIEGISGIHDRSDKDGIEVLVDLKRGAIGEVVLNQIYAHTPMEGTFGIINLVLVSKQPKVLGIYPLINEFIEFRKEVVRRRCAFELKEAEERAHILEGLRVALERIDAIVTFLKKTKDIAEARAGLMKAYSLSEKQANAILDMKISRLVALERQKIEDEYAGLVKTITWLKGVLADVNKILKIIKDELHEVRKKYGDERRTSIVDVEDEITAEELIPNDQVVVTISGRGYVKRVGLDEYRTQHRGGKGVVGTETKEQDFVQDVIVVKNHNNILFFTDKGRVFWLKAYQIPEAGRYAAGKSLVNLLDLKEEKVSSWIPVPEFKPDEYLVMVTKDGIVKRTSLENFSHPRKNGIIAITLRDKDQLVGVIKTDGKEELVIATKQGQAIRFNENDAREIGRSGMGVIGIRLKDKDDAVVGVASCKKYPSILTITENGYGKRTATDEYRLQGRGGSGVINIKTEGRNGAVVGARGVLDSDEVIVISSKGQTIRTPVTGISVIGRNTQGVRIIRLQEEEGEKVASFAVVPKEEKIEEVKTTA